MLKKRFTLKNVRTITDIVCEKVAKNRFTNPVIYPPTDFHPNSRELNLTCSEYTFSCLCQPLVIQLETEMEVTPLRWHQKMDDFWTLF